MSFCFFLIKKHQNQYWNDGEIEFLIINVSVFICEKKKESIFIALDIYAKSIIMK